MKTLQQLIIKIRQHQDPTQPLILSNLDMDDNTLIPLISVINGNHKIRNLDLSFNILSNKGASHLSQLKFVRKLNLSANRITDKGVLGFYGNQSLTHLNLNFNTNVSDKSVLGLINESKIKNLELLACSISATAKSRISEQLVYS